MTTTLPTARTYTERGTTVVSRTVMDTGRVMYFEITVIRSHRQINPTFQGTVFLRDSRWIAEAILPGRRGTEEIGDGFAEYFDAENALVKRRTGVVSEQPWTGPRPRRCEQCDDVVIGECPRPNCYRCGNHLNDRGECSRPHLHWTPASIAAEEAARAERRRTRQTQLVTGAMA